MEKFDKALNEAALTVRGREWIKKALDPAHGDRACIPDASDAPVVCSQFTTTLSLARPSTVAAGNSWDCIIIGIPATTLGVIVASGAAGINFDTAAHSSVDTVVDTMSGQALYDTTNTQLVNAAADQPGYTAQLTVNTYQSSLYYNAFRVAAKSLTVHNTSSKLVDGGTVYSAQFPRKIMRTQCGYISYGFNTVSGMGTLTLPMSETDLSLLSPQGMRTDEARNGVYVVHKLNGPDQNFVSPEHDCMWIGRKSDGGSDSAVYVNNAFDASPYSAGSRDLRLSMGGNGDTQPGRGAPWTWNDGGGGTNNRQPNIWTDGVDQGVAFSVTIFRGLPSDATLSVKQISVLEFTPTSVSPFKTFVSYSPPPDPEALRLYYTMTHGQSMIYRADANSLALVAPLILRALAMFGRTMLPHLKAIGAASLSAGASEVAKRITAAPVPKVVVVPKKKK